MTPCNTYPCSGPMSLLFLVETHWISSHFFISAMSVVPLHDVCRGMEQELQIYSCGLLSTLSGAICKDYLRELSQPLCEAATMMPILEMRRLKPSQPDTVACPGPHTQLVDLSFSCLLCCYLLPFSTMHWGSYTMCVRMTAWLLIR